MTGQKQHKTSLRARSRQWSTLACLALALMGAVAISGQHYLYGVLFLSATLLLFKDSSLRQRRSASLAKAHPQGDLSAARRRALRKAA